MPPAKRGKKATATTKPAASTYNRRTRATGFSPGGPQQLEDNPRRRMRRPRAQAPATASASASAGTASTSPEPTTSADDSEPSMNNSSNALIVAPEAKTPSSNNNSPTLTKTLNGVEGVEEDQKMPAIKFKPIHRGLIELGQSIYGKCPGESDEEELSDDDLGFSDGPAYTANALRTYRNPPGFKRENIPFDIPPQSTDSPRTLRRLAEKAKQLQDPHSNSGPSTVSKSTRQPPYVVFARPNEKKCTITRSDLVDATRSLVQWAERDKDHVVPNAEQLEAMLEQFNTQQKANTIAAAPEAPKITETEEKYNEAEKTSEESMIVSTPTQSTSENMLAAVSAGEEQVRSPHPQTPTPATPQRPQTFGSSLFVGLSAVKSLVATPFTFFGRRAQPGDAAAINAPVDSPTTETPSLTNTEISSLSEPDTVTQTPIPYNEPTEPSLRPTQIHSHAETDLFTQTNDIVATNDAPSTPRHQPFFQSNSTYDVAGQTPRPLARFTPQTAPARIRPRQLKGNLMKTPAEPRSVRIRRQEQKLKLLGQPIQSRGLLTEKEKQDLWAQQDKEKAIQRESNTHGSNEEVEHSQYSLNSSRLGEKRKSFHQESQRTYPGAVEAANQRAGDRQSQRAMNERQLDDDDDGGEENSPTQSRNNDRIGQKRKKPHKEPVPREQGTYRLPDFSSDSDESSDADESPIPKRRFSKPRRSVRWADEVTQHDPENVPLYQGDIARQPPTIQHNLEAGTFPLHKVAGFDDIPSDREKEPPKKTSGSFPPKNKKNNLFVAAARLKAEQQAKAEAEALEKQQQEELSKRSGSALPSSPNSHSEKQQQEELSKRSGSALSSSPSPLQEQEKNQSAPPPPRPANAQLPPQDTLAKAYTNAQPFKPITGSRLRQVSNISSPSTPTSENKENDGGAVFSQAVCDLVDTIDPSLLEHFDIPPAKEDYAFDPQVLADLDRIWNEVHSGNNGN